MPERELSGAAKSRHGAHRPLARRFTYRYAIAMAIMALVIAWGLLSVDRTLQTADRASLQLETAAAQPALVAEVYLAARALDSALDSGDSLAVEEAARSLNDSANELRENQIALTEGDEDLPITGPPDGELAEFLPGEGRLTERVNELAAAALETAEASDVDEVPETILAEPDELAAVLTDLQTAVELYAEDLDNVIDGQREAMVLRMVVAVSALGLLVLVLFRPMARRIQAETTQLEWAERQQREDSERQRFRNDLFKALDVCEDEREVLETVERALSEVLPDRPAELLTSDSEQTTMNRSAVNPEAGAAGCPVDKPGTCPALRAGQTMLYPSSRMLNVCPKLPLHPELRCSAACVPLVFNGASVGVLHAVAAEHATWETTTTERLEVVAQEVANRIGTLRITRATERQARHDALTDLSNRRTLTEQVRQLLDDGMPFSLAMADLDHFKELNDTFGHEAGDRALQLFAACLRRQLRPQDIIARYGGEEFVIVLPETDLGHAARAIQRLQGALAEEIQRRQAVPFTASWGLTDSGAGRSFEAILNVADLAMYDAKRAGRNCLVVDGEAAARQRGQRSAAAGT